MKKYICLQLLDLLLFMPFPPDHNHEISFDDAALLTKRFRESIEPGDRIAGFFNSESIKKLLEQEGCVGIRFYYGYNISYELELVLVGVNGDGNDIINDGGLCFDMSLPCPEYCSDENILNT